MAIFKFLIIGASGLAVLGGSTFYLMHKIEQDQLNEDSGWDDFNTKWDSIDTSKLKLLSKELEEICKDSGSNCTTKEGIINETQKKRPSLANTFRNNLDGPSGTNSGFDATCKEMAKEFKHIKVFCP